MEQPSRQIPDKIKEVVSLYIKTKSLILKAEQLDPSLSSNVAIIKEQRDALDHLMRVLGDFFSESPQGEKYRDHNMSKVVGHLCRAGYDALDSLSIALKLRIAKAVKDRSNESIQAVFPDYYSQHYTTIQEIDDRVQESRGKKEFAIFNIETLNAYMGFMERLEIAVKAAEKQIPAMVEYDLKNSKAKAAERAHDWLLWALFTVLGTVLYWLVEKFFLQR
jgi:hypothetical protein